MPAVDDAFDAYRLATGKLEQLYVERAESLAAELTVRADAYSDLCARGDRNITQIREEADHAAHFHKVSAIKLAGEIDALLAKLRLLDAQLSYMGFMESSDEVLG